MHPRPGGAVVPKAYGGVIVINFLFILYYQRKLSKG